MSAAVEKTESGGASGESSAATGDAGGSASSGGSRSSPAAGRPLRAYATGKRKDAVARVWLTAGGGGVKVNGREVSVYFSRPSLRSLLNAPFVAAGVEERFDVVCTVRGGGLSGQAGALRHGISRALVLYDDALRPPLRKAGLITRDARIVERKKYGRHKARRSPQFSKR